MGSYTHTEPGVTAKQNTYESVMVFSKTNIFDMWKAFGLIHLCGALSSALSKADISIYGPQFTE